MQKAEHPRDGKHLFWAEWMTSSPMDRSAAVSGGQIEQDEELVDWRNY